LWISPKIERKDNEEEEDDVKKKKSVGGISIEKDVQWSVCM
jgi:hypothetical protein